jgi:hypothetical protein
MVNYKICLFYKGLLTIQAIVIPPLLMLSIKSIDSRELINFFSHFVNGGSEVQNVTEVHME